MKHLLITFLAMACSIYAMAMEKMTVNGTSREMIVYAPKNLPQQAPLVIACHGMNQDAPYLQNDSHWEEVADTAKFVVVYANGIDKSWDISGDRDVNFVLAIINEMYSRYGINKNRVYLTGFSMGGMFTYHCANKIADKIAAFAPVSGYLMGGVNASASRPIPLLHTHGTGDDVVSYSNAPNHVKAWAKFDGCDATPQTIKPYPVGTSSPAKMEVYKNGKNGVEVALLTLDGKGHWWSRDESQAHTTREVWKFCKRFSLGKPEPTLLSVTPEDKSFDLLSSTDTCFTLLYSDTVRTVNAKVTLTSTNGQSTSLLVGATSNPKEIRFVLPAGTSLADGRYTLSVSSLNTGEGKSMQSQTFTYEYGMSTVSETLKLDTVYVSNLASEKESIAEGIPSGWRRIMTSSSGTTETVNGPAASVAGNRMKYFTPGGDFNEGFYLSARDQASAKLSYGNNSKYPLTINAGNYTITFNSIYWSSDALNNKATFGFGLKSSSGLTVMQEAGLLSTGTMADNSNQKVVGSTAHALDFSVKVSTNYSFYFEMTEGWNSVIVGNIMITSQPSYAERYKGTLYRLLLELQERAKEYDSAEIREAIAKYSDFVSTSPSAYTKAIAEVEALMKKYPSSLHSIQSDSSASATYYNILGQKIATPTHGIYIRNGHKVVVK